MNRLPDWKSIIQEKYASHFVSRPYALKSVVGQGSTIVRQDNAIIVSGPTQDRWVSHSLESHILGAKKIKTWLSQEQAANYVAIKVLVR